MAFDYANPNWDEMDAELAFVATYASKTLANGNLQVTLTNMFAELEGRVSLEMRYPQSRTWVLECQGLCTLHAKMKKAN